jgi:putative redox protein
MPTTKTARLVQIQGISFAGTADSNHWVTMDGPPDFGGRGAATRPKELVLLGLAGCTASDVVSILKKKRVALDRLEVNATAEEREEHPRIYTKIHLEFVLHGSGIKEADVKRAIELSDSTYCSVGAMLKPTVEITHSVTIVPTDVPAIVS